MSFRDDRSIVAVIEVISPANKTVGSVGRANYLQKRQEVIDSDTHLVEIDLLRAGAWVFARDGSGSRLRGARKQAYSRIPTRLGLAHSSATAASGDFYSAAEGRPRREAGFAGRSRDCLQARELRAGIGLQQAAGPAATGRERRLGCSISRQQECNVTSSTRTLSLWHGHPAQDARATHAAHLGRPDTCGRRLPQFGQNSSYAEQLKPHSGQRMLGRGWEAGGVTTPPMAGWLWGTVAITASLKCASPVCIRQKLASRHRERFASPGEADRRSEAVCRWGHQEYQIAAPSPWASWFG